MLRPLVVIGTRPEAIKLAPVILELRERGHRPRIHATGQHDIVSMLAHFGLEGDFFGTGSHVHLTHSLVKILRQLTVSIEEDDSTDFIIGQGDTTSALAASVVAFQTQRPFVHIEAGLRTYDLTQPFPEEYNRRVCTLGATLHCAPTIDAEMILLDEGVDPHNICITGQTSLDALEWTLRQCADLCDEAVLVTMHRRESWDRIPHIVRAVKVACGLHPGAAIYLGSQMRQR